MGDAAAGAVGLWTWTAPAGTSIAKGSVDVQFRTNAPGVTVYLKARTTAQKFEDVDKLDENGGDGSGTWEIPSGRQVVGLAMRSADKHTFGDKWANNLRIGSLALSLSDASAPVVSAAGPLTSGRWLNATTKVCMTVSASDTGSGVAGIELDDASGRAIDSYDVPVQSPVVPGSTTLSHDLCVVPSTLGQGAHALKLVARDASGETASKPVTVNVDTIAPAAHDRLPADRTTSRRPAVSFGVEAGPSGLAAFSADLDGASMTITGSTASIQPTADLSLGTHTVHWSATDGAGNTASGQWSFTVAEAYARSITATGDKRVDAGATATLHFQLVGDATAIAGAKVQLESRVAGAAEFSAGRELTADASGAVDADVTPARTTTYRLSLVALPSVNVTFTVTAVQGLKLASSAHRMRLGHALRLTPWVASHAGRFHVVIQLHTHTGWIEIGKPRVNTTLKVRPLARGRYMFRAIGPKTGADVTSDSRVITVIVR